MRNAFADEILKLAEQDERVVLLAGDIGNRLFNPFKERFPRRFYNCGVAEANMMGVAAGMALSGMRPFAYTIAPFLTSRCFEQIKLDVCYHKAPVTIVGVGAGLSYASLGPTHHTWEDVGLLRMLPGMSIICPCDAWEVRSGLRSALGQEGPVYLRLGKKNEPEVHADVPVLEIGRPIVLREGREVCFLAVGTIMPEVLAAAARLEREGISCGVISHHTVKPLDCDLLTRTFAAHRIVVTVEEHGLIGGLGSAVAEWKADTCAAGRLLRFGMADRMLHEAGSKDHALRHYGLAADQICERVRTVING